MNRFSKVLVLSLSVVIFCYVALGYVLGKTTDNKAYRSLTVFTEVLQRIQQDWVEEPNMALVTSGALHGLLESLDAQSSYLSPREYTEYKKQLQNPSKGEIGAALSKRFGYVTVIAVLPESPASKAGLKPGDILESISGFTTREMSIGQAQILLAGAPGSSVKMAVVRRGRSEPQEMEVVRGDAGNTRIFQDKVMDSEGEIAYLRVHALTAGKAEELRQKLMQIDRQGARKLVLDLRECAVGPASEGVAAAKLFLTSGIIAVLKGQTVPRQEFAAEPEKAVWKHAVTVLTSNSTSGGAEIVASAIADNERGETIGERTFGTASEQKLIPLEDGAALVLTVANYLTAAGKSIPEDGVVPTVKVDDVFDQPKGPAAGDLDPVLKKAIEVLKGGAVTSKSAQQRRPRTKLPAAA